MWGSEPHFALRGADTQCSGRREDEPARLPTIQSHISFTARVFASLTSGALVCKARIADGITKKET